MPNVTPVGYSDDAADELLRKHEQLEKEAAVAKRAPDKPAQPAPTAPRQKAEPVAAAGQAAPGKQGWLEWAGSLVFGEAEDDDLGEKAYQASKRQQEAKFVREERATLREAGKGDGWESLAFGDSSTDETGLPGTTPGDKATGPGRYVEGVGRGILGSTAATLSGIKWIDDYFGLDSFVGRGAERGAELLNQRVQESLERLSGAPNFGDRLAEGFGSMAVFLIPGAGTAAGVARIAAIAPRLARIIGSGTMALTEALAEAGETYQELLDQGVKPDEAAKRAGGVFVRNTVVLAVTNKLGIFAERGSRATRAGVSALMEGVQEAAQYELQRRATGRAFDVTEMTDAALIGAIVGGSVGGVVGPRLGRTREAQPEARPTAPEPQAIEAEAAPAPAPALTPVEQRATEASARAEAAVSKIEDLAVKPEVPREPLPGQGVEAAAEITPTAPPLTPLVTKAQAAAEAAGVDLPDAELLNAARTAAVEASVVADKAKLSEDIEAVLKKQPGVTPEIAAELAPKITEAVKDDPAVGSRPRPERAPVPAAGPRTGEPFEAPVYRGAKGEYFSRPAEGKKPGRTALVRLQKPFVVALPERGVAFEGLRQQFGTEDPVAIATTLRERGYDGLVLSYPGGDFAVFTATPPVETRGAAGRPKPEPRGAAAHAAGVAEGEGATSLAPAATPGPVPGRAAFRGSEDLSWAPNPETGQPRRILDLTDAGELEGPEAVAAALTRRLGVGISADADVAAALKAAGYDVVKYRTPGQEPGQVTWVDVAPEDRPTGRVAEGTEYEAAADASDKTFGESAPQAETRALAEIRQFLGSASLDPQHRRFAEEVRARLEGLRDSRARGADVAAPERAAELDEEARGAINDVLSLPGLDPARAARLGAIKQELERRSPPALGSGRGGRFVRALLEAGRLRLAGLRPLGPYMEVLRSDLEGARATIQQRLRAIADQVETAPAEQLNVEEQNLDALTRWLDKLQADPSRARYQHLHVEPSGKFDIGSFAEMHERRVELATRGKLTVETIREKAAAVKPEWRDNDHSRLRKVVPGEALPAEDILAINDLLVDVGAVVQNAAREARKANYSDESVRKFGDALALFQELDAIRRGPQAEAGRSVRILQDESAEANRRFLAQFEKYLADTTEQPQASEQLVDLIASMKDPAQIQAMVDKMQKRGSWGRAVVDLWVQGLLSGLQTHIVNPVSNVAFLGWLVGERFVGEQFGRLPRLVGEEAGVAPGETIAMLDGIFDAIGHLVTHMQKEKASAMAAVKTELPSVQPDEKPTYFGAPQGVWNSNWVTRGAFYMTHWPGAALGLQDTFARAIAKNAELSALQYREAYRRTAKRDQERKAAGEARMSAREREAYLRERLVELRDETPKSMEREADEFKAYATFTNELTGFMKRLEDLRNSHPLARIAVPFLRTPTNLALRGAERLFAPVNLGLYKDMLSGDPAKRDRAGGIWGASAIFHVLLLKTIAEGLLTGRPPEDPDLRRQWEKAGWKEYSFDVGRLRGMLGYPDGRPADQLPRPGDLVSYSRLDPFASIVGAAVDLWNAAGHLKNGELDALALALGNATVDNFVSETWVHGAAKFLGALNRPAQWKNFADDFVVSVVPNIARQFGRAYQGDMKAFDREVNNFRDWWDNVRARVPGLNAGMESELDLFGNKVLLGGGFGRHFGPEATYWLFDTVSPFHLNTADKPTQRLFEIFRVNEIQVRTAPITINSIPLEHVDRNNIIRLAGGKTIVVNGKTIGPATVLGMTMPKLLAELMTDKTPAWLEAGQGRGGTRQALVNRQVDRYYTEAVKVLANADPAFAKRLAGADIRHLKGRQAESAKQIKEYIREEYNLPSISVR